MNCITPNFTVETYNIAFCHPETIYEDISNPSSQEKTITHDGDHVEVPKKGRKRKLSDEKKICEVCNTPTDYMHYGAICCYACKTFFRRMVLLADKDAKCKYKKTCDLFGGLLCQSCRFDKCLIVGMNPRFIQFPEGAENREIVDHLLRRKQILEERYKPFERNKLIFENASYCYEIDSLLYLESKISKLRESSYNPTFLYEHISEVLLKPCELANAHKYQKPENWPINMDNFDQNADYIYHRLNVLSKRCTRNWFVTDIIITVEAAKTLPIFQKLNLQDQTRLLEHIAIINAQFMEYFYASQKKQSALVYPDGYVPIKMLSKSYDHDVSKLEYKVLYKNAELIDQANLNTIEYILLKSIIYCYSDYSNISYAGRLMLQEQREIYAKMLLKYLQTQLGPEPGAKRYMEVLSLIQNLFAMNEATKKYWIKMDMAKRYFIMVGSYSLDYDEPISQLLDNLLVK